MNEEKLIADAKDEENTFSIVSETSLLFWKTKEQNRSGDRVQLAANI